VGFPREVGTGKIPGLKETYVQVGNETRENFSAFLTGGVLRCVNHVGVSHGMFVIPRRPTTPHLTTTASATLP
jgi:hypothetical protein